MLGKLGIRTEAYPFDFSRVTLDGVIHFVENGFDTGFFPPGPPPFRPECVGIWVLFRGQHTAFAHFDLNDVRIQDAFKRKMERWDTLLRSQDGEPVTFFRTVAARSPLDELTLVERFNNAVERINPNLNFRTVVSVHDQRFFDSPAGVDPRPATAFCPMDERTMLWGVDYTEGPDKTLFDRCQSGYGHVVAMSMNDDTWRAVAEGSFWRGGQANGTGPIFRAHDDTSEATLVSPDDLASWGQFKWRSHDNIALIDGVASVGGTCIGVGSSKCSQEGHCPTCGSVDWHKAGRPFRTERPFTDEEDDILLVHLYRILTGGDKVEAVEQLAHELGRGAYEVICRIQFLTNNSTKLADGVDFP